MKKLLLPLLLLFSITLFAQPVNDDCSGLIDLGVIPFCPDTVWYTNVDATETDIGSNNFPTGCDGGDITFVGRDVFFQFTTNDTMLNVTITVTGLADPGGSVPMSNPQVAIYRGDCLFDELSLLKCAKAPDGESILSVDVVGLDPNTPYFIRVNDYSASATPNSGTFQLCIDEQDPEFTVCDGGSVECTGVLYDCGGPDDDYANNENESFSICPTAPNNACITFTLTYFNMEQFGDAITFYDGPDTGSPVIQDIGGGGVTGGGGVCFVVQASSGCLTVGFSSNGSVVMEGFCGGWECSSQPCDLPDPITTTINPTDEELADFVTTPQTFATITSVNCADGAFGTFSGVDTDLGLDKGIILTSGSVANSVGPNNGGSNSQGNGFPGDADLDVLSDLYSNGSTSQDACVVELDVFVATNELSFEFIFGSEEYPVFVNSTFNDVFGFLVSGPGITGLPALNNQENVAFVPGTATTPIEVNTVNFLTNWEYFRQNEAGPSCAYNGLTSDFLGVKKSLTASIEVIPCTTYHLKFAIGDRGDTALDSGVFIGELKGDVPDLTVNFASGVDYLVEDCTGSDDVLLITLDNPQPDSQYYDVVISGTATLGVDYILNIPSQILIPAGETQLSFPIIPLTDGLVEGEETIIITLSNNFGCGNIELNDVIVTIQDQPVVEIFTGLDTAFVCNGECLQMEANGGVNYIWISTEPGIFDDPFSSSPVACPTVSQWVSVTGFITSAPGCFDVDSVYLQFVDPQMNIVASDVEICVGESVNLSANNNINNTGLIWTPSDFLSADDELNVIATPPVTTTYVAEVSIEGCIATDTVTIEVDTYDPPILTTLDTFLCQGSPILLADSILNTTTNYQWSPSDYIITDTDISGAVSVPQDDIIYTLISSSENNFCADTFEVNIQVAPAEVSIDNGDYLELCLGDSVLLTTFNSTNGVGITWTPDLYLDTLEGGQVWSTPLETVQYFVSLQVGGCIVTDSITIRVDSLPDQDISAIPMKDVYCLGENINLVSPGYFPGDYPDIEFLWDPVVGANSDLDNFNLNITATETFTFTRYTTNRACADTNNIQIIVIDPNSIIVTPIDTLVCSGDDVQLTASSPDTDEFTWSFDPPSAASITCEECPDPVATVLSETDFLIEAEVQGCPIIGQLNVNVLASPEPAFPTEPICLGDGVLLNSNDSLETATYEWTSNPVGYSSSEANPTVFPSSTTTYYLTMDNSVCPAVMDSVTIFVNGPSTLDIIEDMNYCTGDFIELFAVSNNVGTFTWSTGDVTTLSSESEIVLPSEEADTDTYTVNYVSGGCNDMLTASVNVTINAGVQILEIIMDPDTSTINEGDAFTLTPVTDPANPSGATYSWTQGGIVIGTGSTFTDTAYTNPTNIFLSITSSEGCVSPGEDISYTVIPAIWDIPNAFTPDGDQTNDVFRVLRRGNIEILKFQIFSRWGQLVFEGDEDDAATGWNGSFKDKPMPTDVYLYNILIKRPSGEEVELTGDVTLIR